MSFTLFPDTRAALAADSLAGLSVGDALGAQFFIPGQSLDAPPAPPWPWTDDTEEACCIVDALKATAAEVEQAAGEDKSGAGEGKPGGGFDRDLFARLLGERFDPYRGYGPGAVVMLRQIREGSPWPIAAAAAFDGQGSAGNGAAMRAAPLGAWHADSLVRAAEQGARAAEVTHAHAEGIAGGVATTVAAAVAAAARLDGRPVDLLGAVLAHTPPSRVSDALREARRITTAAEAAHELGNGSRSLAVDSVPFAIWVAARHLHDYPAAVQVCIAAGGDMDTTAAMAAGIVAAYTGIAGIPDEWLQAREPLPQW
ncbi:ADP-ribosylglycohydrolase family protein [Actinoplanes sp. TFC3]|uniref:ADP-ribosylglycohydrolase family protein n=1 Tax=Actinoplanes sp. TFC3 TaxID=1710355 RepID=UPI00083762D4|nr:ADP-ribosylglycohydrolase family protein [Actinoplanes sp. TFC3]